MRLIYETKAKIIFCVLSAVPLLQNWYFDSILFDAMNLKIVNFTMNTT